MLFVAYLRMSGTYAATSDGADQALQGWDMLHGNWLLHGWTLGDVTYYTTEIPEYALVEVFRGLGADVVHIAGAVTYTLLVLAVGLLARGGATGRGGWSAWRSGRGSCSRRSSGTRRTCARRSRITWVPSCRCCWSF